MTDTINAVFAALRAYVQEAQVVPSTPTLLIAIDAAIAPHEPVVIAPPPAPPKPDPVIKPIVQS